MLEVIHLLFKPVFLDFSDEIATKMFSWENLKRQQINQQ